MSKLKGFLFFLFFSFVFLIVSIIVSVLNFKLTGVLLNPSLLATVFTYKLYTLNLKCIGESDNQVKFLSLLELLDAVFLIALIFSISLTK